MSRYLLDSSAVIAWLRAEDGSERVRELLQTEEDEVLIPWAVLMECYYGAIQTRDKALALERHTILRHLNVTILHEIDEALYLLAGEFKANYTMSFADSIIAAYAVRYDAILVHKDPEFVPLASDIKLEALPYKPAARNQHRQ